MKALIEVYGYMLLHVYDTSDGRFHDYINY